MSAVATITRDCRAVRLDSFTLEAVGSVALKEGETVRFLFDGADQDGFDGERICIAGQDEAVVAVKPGDLRIHA